MDHDLTLQSMSLLIVVIKMKLKTIVQNVDPQIFLLYVTGSLNESYTKTFNEIKQQEETG